MEAGQKETTKKLKLSTLLKNKVDQKRLLKERKYKFEKKVRASRKTNELRYQDPI